MVLDLPFHVQDRETNMEVTEVVREPLERSPLTGYFPTLLFREFDVEKGRRTLCPFRR